MLCECDLHYFLDDLWLCGLPVRKKEMEVFLNGMVRWVSEGGSGDGGDDDGAGGDDDGGSDGSGGCDGDGYVVDVDDV